MLINTIDAVCEAFDNPTPVHVFRFMADDKFREKVLGKSTSPLLKMFKEQYDEKLRDSEQMSKFSPPINKVGKLLRPAILPIIGQPKSLDFLDIMNKKRIVVWRFSKGRLGEEITQILGSLVVSMVSIAALKREKQKKRPPFLMVVDETHNFTARQDDSGRFWLRAENTALPWSAVRRECTSFHSLGISSRTARHRLSSTRAEKTPSLSPRIGATTLQWISLISPAIGLRSGVSKTISLS